LAENSADGRQLTFRALKSGFEEINMRKITMGLPLAVMAMSVSAQAADEVDLEPGLYMFKSIVDIGQQVVHAEEYEYCILEENSTRTVDELIEEIAGDGDCEVNDVNFGGGEGTATIMCPNTELGFPLTGRVEGYYTSTTYGATTIATSPVEGADVTVTTTATRLMDCPEGWEPPEGYSDKD